MDIVTRLKIETFMLYPIPFIYDNKDLIEKVERIKANQIDLLFKDQNDCHFGSSMVKNQKGYLVSFKKSLLDLRYKNIEELQKNKKNLEEFSYLRNLEKILVKNFFLKFSKNENPKNFEKLKEEIKFLPLQVRLKDTNNIVFPSGIKEFDKCIREVNPNPTKLEKFQLFFERIWEWFLNLFRRKKGE